MARASAPETFLLASLLPSFFRSHTSLAAPLRGTQIRLRISANTAKQQLPSLSEQLSSDPDAQARWKDARSPLLGLGLAEQDADQVMAKSFGWASSPYWGEERVKSMPSPHLVQETIVFLRSLGLSDNDILLFLKKFPEVFGCDIQQEMEKNVKILEKDWGISGNSLKNLLLRNPKVLGYNVDCKGDCMAQCTRCWVRF